MPLVVGLAVAGLVVTALAACGGSHKSAGAAVLPSVAVSVTDPTTAPTTPAPTSTPPRSHKPAPKPTPTPSPKAAIPDDGTVVVGQDVPAGTYETLHATTDCYWEIDVHASGQLVDSSLGKSGHLTVTLKAGEDFTTEYCGDWAQK